jgi:hypothetical protein
MTNITRVLEEGIHILSLPLEKEMPIEALFPKEISGSIIERYVPVDDDWEDASTILYENNAFHVDENYASFKPFDTIRLELKRPITLKWRIGFENKSALKRYDLKFEEGFDLKEALYFAQLSNLVYENEDYVKEVIDKQFDFETFYYSSMQNYTEGNKKGLAKLFMLFFKEHKGVVDLQFMQLGRKQEDGTNLIVVVFRGSQEPEDWMTNFNFDDDDFQDKGGVHQGFKEAMDLFFKTMKEKQLVSNAVPISGIDAENFNENNKIILTGHSLGGALAILSACYLYELGIKKENIEVYTFGSPPVGTEEFCQYYEDKINLYRVINENDVVPKLDKITKFVHMGAEVILPSNEGEIHACEGYIDNLIDVIPKEK